MFKSWLRRQLFTEVYALPLDAFRVLVGCLGSYWFLQAWLQIPDFSGPDGLLDHALLREAFPYTQIGLFTEGLSEAFFYGVFSIGILLSLCIVVGVAIKPCAAIAFVLASSTYRHNFLVISVDDTVVHLLFFWLLILPVGKTLTLRAYRQHGPQFWRGWLDVTVPGFGLRCLLANLLGIYLIAGLWKLDSPMWRSGFAMYPIMRLPIAYAPDAWGPEHLPWIRWLTHASLAAELLVPLGYWLIPRGHRWRPWILLLQLPFHIGILLILPIPLANLALMLSPVLFFGDDLVLFLRKSIAQPPKTLTTARPWRFSHAFYALLVVLIYLASTPMPLRRVGQMPLWGMGIAQNYRLFNWIDGFNVHATHHIQLRDDQGTRSEGRIDDFIPQSLRGKIMSIYLLNRQWFKTPPGMIRKIRQGLIYRARRRFCRRSKFAGRVDWWLTFNIVTPQNTALDQPRSFRVSSFDCRNMRASR